MFLFNVLVFGHLILSRSRNLILLIVSLVVLVIVCGYRSVEVGTDTINYYLNFLRYEAGQSLRSTEPLWFLVNKLVIYFGGNFDTLKVTASFLTLAPFYLGVRKASNFPILSIFIFLSFYYYFYGFNIIRQCIASSWCFLGMIYYDTDKPRNFKTYVCLLIGFGFHFTAILVPIMLWVYNGLRRGNISLFLLQGITAVIGLVFSDIFVAVARRFMEDYSTLSTVEGSVLGSIINVAILNIGFIVISNFVKTKDKWFYFFFMFIILTNLMIRIPFGNRFIMYAGITITVFLPNLFNNLKLEKKYNLLLLVLIIVYCYSRFIRILGSGEILPYVNVLFD